MARRRYLHAQSQIVGVYRAKGFATSLALEWLAPLLIRLFVGYFFFETGWAKLHNLDAFAARFMQWGIPHPAFNAALSAYTECLGGALTVAGLGMRFVSIPMMINMAVAIITVKMRSVAGLNDFVELDEPLYALVYFWLLVSGAGYLSLDYLIRPTILSVTAIPAAAESPPLSRTQTNVSSRGHGNCAS